jgi:hypothetical protein
LALSANASMKMADLLRGKAGLAGLDAEARSNVGEADGDRGVLGLVADRRV